MSYFSCSLIIWNYDANFCVLLQLPFFPWIEHLKLELRLLLPVHPFYSASLSIYLGWMDDFVIFHSVQVLRLFGLGCRRPYTVMYLFFFILLSFWFIGDDAVFLLSLATRS